MKTKQDNDVIDRIDVVYVENKTELSWPIGPSTVCDENQTWQWHDQSNKSSLHWNQN